MSPVQTPPSLKSADFVPIEHAVHALQAMDVGVESLHQLLCEGSSTAEGLIAYRGVKSRAGWGEIHRTWWRHLNSPFGESVAYFDEVATNPPAPFRAEHVQVPSSVIDLLTPPGKREKHPELPRATPATLRRWAEGQWSPDELPGRDELVAEAQKYFSGANEVMMRGLRRAYASGSNKKGGARRHGKKR